MPAETFKIINSRHRIIIEERRITAYGGNYSSFFPALNVNAEVVHNLERRNRGALEHRNQEPLPYVFLQAKGEMSFSDHNVTISQSAPIFESRSVDQDGTDAHLNFRFPLDAQRVAGIEEHRSGKLGLNLRFEFMYALSQGEFKTGYANIEVEIAQSRWVNNILPELGAGKRFIVEVPQGRSEAKSAWQHIDQAERAFAMRDFKSGATHCREAGNALNSYVQDHLPGTFAYQESWGRAYKGFSRHASLYLHEEDQKKRSQFEGEDLMPSKADADHLLLRAKALAKYAEELRQREKLKID